MKTIGFSASPRKEIIPAGVVRIKVGRSASASTWP